MRLGWKVNVAACVALLLVLAACGPFVSADPTYHYSILTGEDTPNGDFFQLHDYYGLTLVAANAGNTGTNTRVIFTKSDASDVGDSAACETFSNPPNTLDQEGLAFHVTGTDATNLRAITVTKNIWLGPIWIFNVHVWDDANTSTPLTLISSTNLQSTMFYQPYPWRLCAQITGTTLDWKVWPVAQPEPAWGDPNYGASTQIPPGWQAP